jgi:hypothetical protein
MLISMLVYVEQVNRDEQNLEGQVGRGQKVSFGFGPKMQNKKKKTSSAKILFYFREEETKKRRRNE